MTAIIFFSPISSATKYDKTIEECYKQVENSYFLAIQQKRTHSCFPPPPNLPICFRFQLSSSLAVKACLE